MSTSGPWVSADKVVRPGDIWNTELPLLVVRSGTFVLSGGGNLAAVERAGHPGGGTITGGGAALAETGAKHAIATMAPEATYGVGTYGNSTYGTLPHLSGGGSTHLGGVWTLGGGGSAAESGVAHRRGTFSLSGGGFLSAVAAKSVSGAFAISGGGDGTAAATGTRRSSVAISGGGTQDIVEIKGALASITIAGGGQATSAGTKRTYFAILVSGGGTPVSAGIKHAFAVTVDDTYGNAIYGPGLYGPGVHVHGGGRLWGPFPIVLLPGIRIVTGESLVAIKTGGSKVKVLTTSAIRTRS